jgi:hypothetical protein
LILFLARNTLLIIHHGISFDVTYLCLFLL